jgi:hypothetical protein
MRFFDRAHDTHRIRFTVKKLLHARYDRGSRGTMPAAGVRRDDQDLRDTLLLRHLLLSFSRLVVAN